MKTEDISLPKFNLTITEIDGDIIDIKGRKFKPVFRADFKNHDVVDYKDNEFVLNENNNPIVSRILAFEIVVVNGLEFVCPLYSIGRVEGQMDSCHITMSEEILSSLLSSKIIRTALGNSFNNAKFAHSFIYNRISCKVSPFETSNNNESMLKNYPGFMTTTLISLIQNKKMSNFVVARFNDGAHWGIFKYKSGRVGFEEMDNREDYDTVMNILYVTKFLDEAKGKYSIDN